MRERTSATPRLRRGGPPTPAPAGIPPETLAFYRSVMNALRDHDVPYLVGGAYALHHHAGIERHTRDLDLFVKRETLPLVGRVARELGYEAREFSPHWLWKITTDVGYVDLIYGSGNGTAPVDDSWFEYSVESEVFGIPARLIPAEEMIWSKAYIMERERYDGADVAHILLEAAESLDWQRLLWRFGAHWRILYAHLVLFGFVFPGHRHRVPPDVMRELQSRLEDELAPGAVAGPFAALCGGTVLSRSQYLIDTRERGFRDARLAPFGSMSAAEVEAWTRLAEEEARAAMPYGSIMRTHSEKQTPTRRPS